MKFTIVTLFLVFIITSCSTTNILVIPANQSVEIDYDNLPAYDAQIKNKSMSSIDVAVLNKVSGEQIRGFGLGMKANETVMVEQENKLVLKNTSSKSLKVKVEITEKAAVKTASKPKTKASSNVNSNKNTNVNKNANTNKKSEYISFTLLNKSAKSIPLIIPNVMNPNLSPFSNSGVSLKIGQEILFRAKGRKYILLTVDDTIKNGDKLDVGKLLKARKEELGL